MAICAGVGLYLVAHLGRAMLDEPAEVSVAGYSVAFGILGFILTVTGLHMTLTWPLAPDFPFDNIVFGEPALGFGVLLSAAAVFGWRRGTLILEGPEPLRHLEKIARPTSVFVAALGLAMIGIAAAGLRYRLFAAPPKSRSPAGGSRRTRGWKRSSSRVGERSSGSARWPCGSYCAARARGIGSPGTAGG